MKSKKIVLVSTGGTIASKKNPETGLLTAGLMTGEELSTKCKLPKHINLEIVSIFQIPSNQMTFNKLETLKEKIEEIFNDKDVGGVVVTHGTDTLEETAYFLDLTINETRPLVVTGSQRGPDVVGTDAFVNLRQSILLATNDQAHNIGVLTLFNERIFSAKYIKKVDASNVAGFNTFGYGYLGIMDQDDVKIYQKPIFKEHYNLIDKLPKVEIIKTSIGSSDIFIQHAVDVGLKGIVIEAAGRGHVPPEIMSSIRDAVRKGLMIILTTSTEKGEVKTIYDFPGSVYDLKNASVILGSDYDSKKARIKLAVLLAAKKENLQSYFQN